MKKVYFVRHGETDANVNRIIAGGEFESRLTPTGKNQAVKAGQILKDKNITLIISSPMERTIDTAKIIAKEIGYDSKKISPDPRFIEVFNGYYSGKSYDLRDKHVDEGKLIDSIEPAVKVHKRVKDGLNALKETTAENILLVSHGGTGRMVKAIVENIPHEDFWNVEKFGNTEIYEFELN